MANLASLLRRLGADRRRVFAVLDGAQFDDLPSALRAAGFAGRSLYLDRGMRFDAGFIRSAPHLVALGTDLAGIAELVGTRPAAVFWVAADEGALFRHLRSINKVKVAAGGADDGSGDEIVLFRHADANVMAQVLQSLDEVAFARLLGPAEEILFAPDAEWAGGRSAMSASAVPGILPRQGLLALDAATLARVDARRRAVFDARTQRYLRNVLPPQMVEDMGEERMRRLLAQSRASGEELGLRTEAGHKRWAFMMAVTDGRVAREQLTRDYMRSGPGTPDDRVKAMIDETADALRSLD